MSDNVTVFVRISHNQGIFVFC